MAGDPRVLGLLEEMLSSGKCRKRCAATAPSCSPKSGGGGNNSSSSTRRSGRCFRALGQVRMLARPRRRRVSRSHPRPSAVMRCGAPWGRAASAPSTSATIRNSIGPWPSRCCTPKCATAQAGESALQEARRLAQLRHPGIVAVHDVGMHEGQVYIVSDYLDGPDLGRWLRDHRPAWPEAARIAAAVADALAHAHARLIIHRDVKPANILLGADRAPVLVDFGLALDEAQAGGAREGRRRRHPVVHVAGAGGRHGPPHRRPHRRLQPGRGALRNAHRPRAVPGDRSPGTLAAGARRRAAASPAARPRHPARAGTGVPQGAGEAAAGSLHHRRGLRRRPAPGPPDGSRGAGFPADAS